MGHPWRQVHGSPWPLGDLRLESSALEWRDSRDVEAGAYHRVHALTELSLAGLLAGGTVRTGMPDWPRLAAPGKDHSIGTAAARAP
jgi:hypothetical protein